MFLLVLIGILFTLVYSLNNYLFSFWSRKGFKQLKPTFIFGDVSSVFTAKASMGEFFENVYRKYKSHKILGVYFSYRPVLVVNDSKLVQDIMIKDFTSFHDRPMPVDEENDPLSAHLFNIGE